MKKKQVSKVCTVKDFHQQNKGVSVANHLRQNKDLFIKKDPEGRQSIYKGWIAGKN